MTTKLPNIPEYDGTNAAEVVSALKEALEVRVGRRGDALDAGVTFRDLEALGVVQSDSTGSASSLLSTPVRVRSTLLDGAIPELYDPTKDLTTPPAPSELRATAVFDTVFLSWNMSGFPNQSYWEIHRAFANDLSSAALIGTSTSQFFTDVVGEDRTVYYWVRTVSAAGIKSAWNSSFGTEVKTGIDPAKLIRAIEGEILESSLSKDLASRISDANDQARITVRKLSKEVQDRIAAVSANTAAINAEIAARIAAVQQEAQTRAQAILDEAAARGTAITNEATTRANADNALAQQITTLTATAAGTYATISALQAEQTARADGDSAQTTARETLAAQLRGTYTGTDVTQLTTGLVYSERQARVTADSALATRSDALEATVNNPTTGLVATRATLINDYYTKASTDSAIATASNTLSSQINVKNRTYRQASAPTTGLVEGDVWFDSDDSNKSYRYAGGQWVATDDTRIAGTIATLTNNYYTKTDTDGAIAAATLNLVSQTSLNNTLGSYVTNSTLTNNYYTKSATDSAISAATQNLVSNTSLSNTLGSYVTNATLTNNYLTATQTNSAISAATTGLVSQTTLNTTLNSYVSTATLTNGYYTKTQTDSAISAATTGLVSSTTLNNYVTTATLTADYYTKTATDSAISASSTTLTSNFNNTLTNYATTAAVQQNFFAKADGQALQGQYTVKIDLNGHVSGFGLASTVTNGTPTSAFIIRADRFAIVDPASTANNLTLTPSSDTVPFAYVSGVAGVPNGVYIKDAFIQNASITDAKIGSVAAKKITAGYVTASIAFNGSQVYGASLYSGGTTSTSYDAQGNVIGFTANNPTFKVEGGNVEVVSTNFRIKSLATATSYVTPFKVENGVVYIDTLAVIKAGDITTAMIQNAQITSAQITNLEATKIVPGPNGLTIDANLITLDGNVTLDTYYDSSIGRSRLRIKDLGVTTAKIDDLAVTTGKIANLAVGTLKIAGNAITQPEVYTAADVYIPNNSSAAIVMTNSGVNESYNYVGAGNGDYAYVLIYYNPSEPDYVMQYVGSGNGDHVRVVTYSAPTFTGAITVIETPTVTVGVDATAAVQIVYYATHDGSIYTYNDSGQHLFMLLDTGAGYRLVAQQQVGLRTDSSADTMASLPIAMTFTARNITTARVKILTGSRRVDLPMGNFSNACWLRNSTISLLGAKR